MNPSKLWQDNKFLFFLALPVILIVVFKDLLIAILAGRSHADVKEASKKDEEAKNRIHEKEKEAVKLETEIEMIAEKIENRKTDDVSLDWHKTFKKD